MALYVGRLPFCLFFFKCMDLSTYLCCLQKMWCVKIEQSHLVGHAVGAKVSTTGTKKRVLCHVRLTSSLLQIIFTQPLNFTLSLSFVKRGQISSIQFAILCNAAGLTCAADCQYLGLTGWQKKNAVRHRNTFNKAHLTWRTECIVSGHIFVSVSQSVQRLQNGIEGRRWDLVCFWILCHLSPQQEQLLCEMVIVDGALDYLERD